MAAVKGGGRLTDVYTILEREAQGSLSADATEPQTSSHNSKTVPRMETLGLLSAC